MVDVAQEVHIHVRILTLAQGRLARAQIASPHGNVVGRRRDLVHIRDHDPLVLDLSQEVLDLQAHALHPCVSERHDRVAVRHRDAACVAAVRHRQVATPTIRSKHRGFIFHLTLRY